MEWIILFVGWVSLEVKLSYIKEISEGLSLWMNFGLWWMKQDKGGVFLKG